MNPLTRTEKGGNIMTVLKKIDEFFRAYYKCFSKAEDEEEK
jgi:hypothetical protein